MSQDHGIDLENRDGELFLTFDTKYVSDNDSHVMAMNLGNPVEFLEEVFRFYLTNWNTSLDTSDKEEFRKILQGLIGGVQKKNTIKEEAYRKAEAENLQPGDPVEVIKGFKADRTPCPKVGTIGRFINFNRQYYFVEFNLPFEDTTGVIWEPWDDRKSMKMGFQLDEIKKVNNV